MDLTHYILNEDHTTEAVTMDQYIEWIKQKGYEVKRVALDEDEHNAISTVFLGLDHNFGTGAPLLFETMVFGKLPDGRVDYSEKAVDRYTTYDEALAGHKALAREWLTRTWTGWLKGLFTRSK